MLHEEGDGSIHQGTGKWEPMLPALVPFLASKAWTSVQIPDILWKTWVSGQGQWGSSSGSRPGYSEWRLMLSNQVFAVFVWFFFFQTAGFSESSHVSVPALAYTCVLTQRGNILTSRNHPQHRELIGIWPSQIRKSQEFISPSEIQASAEASLRFLPLRGNSR